MTEGRARCSMDSVLSYRPVFRQVYIERVCQREVNGADARVKMKLDSERVTTNG